MAPMSTLALWVLVVVFVGLFAAQVATRVRLIAGAPNTFSTDNTALRITRFLTDVVGQRQTIVERTHTRAFTAYRMVLTPFALAVLCGIVYLLVRRAFLRPVALGSSVSIESIVIGLFITTLMVTFL